MTEYVYPSSACRRCGVDIVCIPTGDGLWVHVSSDTGWGYDSALCQNAEGGLVKRGVLQTAKPRKKDRDAGWWGKP